MLQGVALRRFGYLSHFANHETATRYCYNDYDREMAIVVELEQDGERRLAGVGRLVADPNHDAAEYAVLIGDAWQGCGLGKTMTEYCIEVGREWGVRRIVAQTSKTNARVIAILKTFGFTREVDLDSGEVHAQLELSEGGT